MLNLLFILWSLIVPHHDFHTSWMNMTYDEESNVFETTWRTDTEHLEAVLSEFSNREILLDNITIDDHKSLINKYLAENTRLYFNEKKQSLETSIIEVNFAETIVHFEPIKCKRKLKTVAINCTLLQSLFPNQKNMVQINYKGEMYSMLLGGNKVFEKIELIN